MAKDKTHLETEPKTRLSLPSENSCWFRYTTSDTVMVFIHGSNSDSVTSWLYRNSDASDRDAYWPELVASDSRFGEIGIYLAGYASVPNGGDYNIKNCADEVFSVLTLPDNQHKERDTVLQKPKLIFVCHSQGGIVARHFLVNKRERFQEKDIGLVLIASPSDGSGYASLLQPLAKFCRNEQAIRLRSGDPTLQELDDQFRDLKEKLPKLVGVEFYETQSVLRWIWPRCLVTRIAPIVSKRSAVRYFTGRAIPQADHWSICKPKSRTDVVHQYLLEFLLKNNLLPSVQTGGTQEGLAHKLIPRGGAEVLKSDSHPPDSASSSEELNHTMSNPRYSDDILRLDGSWNRHSVINRETIIIVVGTNVVSELLDRPVAEMLRDRIDALGQGFPFRRGIVITDVAWPSERAVLEKNPVIAVGGPPTNQLSDEFNKWVPPSPSSGGIYPIAGSARLTGFFRKNGVGLPQVGLWGQTATATREAVENYIVNPKGLSDFLRMCWKPC